MATRVGPTEYGGRGGRIQRLSDGHNVADAPGKDAQEQRMILARQMRSEKGGVVNQVRDPATGRVVGVEPISEEQVLEEYYKED